MRAIRSTTALPPLASCVVPEVGGESRRRWCWQLSAKNGVKSVPRGEAVLLMVNSTSGPVVLPVIDKGAQDVCNDTVDQLNLGCSVVVLWQPKNEGGAQRMVQRGPKLHRELAVPIGHYDIGEANVAENQGYKVASRHLQRGRPEGQDQPHATSQQVNVNLHEVVALALLGQFKEVQGDCAAPAARNREGEEETCLWPVLGLGPLARWARGNEGCHVCRDAWPPYQAPSQSHGLVVAKVAAQWRVVQLFEDTAA